MFRNKQGNEQSQQYRTGSKEEGGTRDDGILRKKQQLGFLYRYSPFPKICLATLSSGFCLFKTVFLWLSWWPPTQRSSCGIKGVCNHHPVLRLFSKITGFIKATVIKCFWKVVHRKLAEGTWATVHYFGPEPANRFLHLYQSASPKRKTGTLESSKASRINTCRINTFLFQKHNIANHKKQVNKFLF